MERGLHGLNPYADTHSGFQVVCFYIDDKARFMGQELILVVEDEPEIAEILTTYLLRAGFKTRHAIDGKAALMQFRSCSPDLVLLDINLPEVDGHEVLLRIRQTSDTPVIMVTASDEDIEKISTLRLGADDYIVKPFNNLEVVERVKAVLRRTTPRAATEDVKKVGPLLVDTGAHAVFVVHAGSQEPIQFTHTEYSIIAHMSAAPKRAFSRLELIEACFPEGDTLERTVDSHVSNARRKLELAGVSGFLETVRGFGYRLESL